MQVSDPDGKAKPKALVTDELDRNQSFSRQLIQLTGVDVPVSQAGSPINGLVHSAIGYDFSGAYGKLVDEREMAYFKLPIRYHDIALSADGGKLYLAVDSSMTTSGPSKEDPKITAYRGCILEFTYLPGRQPTNGFTQPGTDLCAHKKPTKAVNL